VAIIYNISVGIYLCIIYIASVFNKKAKQWIAGRKGIWLQIEEKVKNDKPLAWFHSSSLGEFEQGRPVIEAFRKKYPTYRILLTFFSPSGFEIRKNYEGADYVFYLPADFHANVNKFLQLTKPTVAFFVKYDYWFNYIRVLKKLNIPLYIISASFRPNHYFFKWYGKWFAKQLSKITHFFVQQEQSIELLKKINISQTSVCGDTRVDRVFSITQQVQEFPLIQNFCKGSSIFIGGSTWQPDEDIIVKLINSEKYDYKFIIAPHIVDKPHIASLAEKIKLHLVKYSEADNENIKYAKVLIVDSIGILSHIYKYGRIAYIGGGFGSGIHNTLEAATFGMPIIFGPKYQKFPEAVSLIKDGGAFCIHNDEEFENCFNRLANHPDLIDKAGKVASDYIKNNLGATEKILNNIKL